MLCGFVVGALEGLVLCGFVVGALEELMLCGFVVGALEGLLLFVVSIRKPPLLFQLLPSTVPNFCGSLEVDSR